MIARTLVSFCFVVGCTGASPLQSPLPTWDTPHARALADHHNEPPFGPEAVVAYVGGGRSRDDSAALVIGYLPYWSDAVDLDWDRLDVLVWFNVDVEGDGALGSDHGWGDAGHAAVLESAHAAGVRVTLGATRFGGDALHELLSDVGARQAAVTNLVDRMVSGNGDGIDVDFEGLLVGDRDTFLLFVEDLRAAMDAVRPGSTLTLATPAIDWQGSYDYSALAEASDALFVMGYAFHGSWGDPGPQAPLDGSDLWGDYSLTWAVDDYLTWAGPENARKVVLGLPLYGWEWDADGPDPGAHVVGSNDNAVFWDEARAVEADHGALWDPSSATPFVSWQVDGQWHQMWCDDAVSIGMKMEMAREKGLGGVGFWALGYDGGDDELWTAVRDVTQNWDEEAPGDDDDSTQAPGGGPPVPAVSGPGFVLVGEDAVLDASSTVDPEGDTILWAWTQIDGAPVQLRDAGAAVARFVAVEPGTFRFQIAATDGASDPVTAEVQVVVLPAEDERFYLRDPSADLGYGCGAALAGRDGGWAALLLLATRAVRRRRYR